MSPGKPWWARGEIVTTAVMPGCSRSTAPENDAANPNRSG
jgi:hypothetical protein